jgi:hypothetical protein
MAVSGQLHAPAALPPGDSLPILIKILGWVGPRRVSSQQYSDFRINFWGSENGGYEECYILGRDAVQSGTKYPGVLKEIQLNFGHIIWASKKGFVFSYIASIRATHPTIYASTCRSTLCIPGTDRVVK